MSSVLVRGTQFRLRARNTAGSAGSLSRRLSDPHCRRTTTTVAPYEATRRSTPQEIPVMPAAYPVGASDRRQT
jgi:hypothetical protein